MDIPVRHSAQAGPRPREAATAATIAATATAVPPHILARDQCKTYVNKVFGITGRRLEAVLSVIDNSQIKTRHAIFPLDYLIEPRPLTQTSQEYQKHAVCLGRQVAADALARAGMKATDIDLLITVSCTGVMIPSLDAHLINDLGFRADVRRLPVTELGCAAGAASCARGADYIRAYPERSVLVVSVEIPSLTFQRGDLTQANLISCVLFGDGAAAAVITGRPAAGPRIIDADTFLFPNSLDAMGFDLRDSGFHIVLSKDVPDLIRSKIKELLTGFLERNGLDRQQLSAFVLHPGGQKLLAYMEQELGLGRCDTQFSWDVLRDYGNLSSASVLFVLHEWLNKRPMDAGAYGLMAAFGPGFSAEMLLLQWP